MMRDLHWKAGSGPRRDDGFRHIELLVVISFVGIPLLFVLPEVQGSHTADYRVCRSCSAMPVELSVRYDHDVYPPLRLCALGASRTRDAFGTLPVESSYFRTAQQRSSSEPFRPTGQMRVSLNQGALAARFPGGAVNPLV